MGSKLIIINIILAVIFGCGLFFKIGFAAYLIIVYDICICILLILMRKGCINPQYILSPFNFIPLTVMYIVYAMLYVPIDGEVSYMIHILSYFVGGGISLIIVNSKEGINFSIWKKFFIFIGISLIVYWQPLMINVLAEPTECKEIEYIVEEKLEIYWLFTDYCLTLESEADELCIDTFAVGRNTYDLVEEELKFKVMLYNGKFEMQYLNREEIKLAIESVIDT